MLFRGVLQCEKFGKVFNGILLIRNIFFLNLYTSFNAMDYCNVKHLVLHKQFLLAMYTWVIYPTYPALNVKCPRTVLTRQITWAQ